MKEKKNRRGTGIVLLVCGIVSLILGIWLFSKIFGTQLLFTGPMLGQLCKYFWILILAGVVLIAIGRIMIKKNTDKEVSAEQAAESGKEVVSEQARAVPDNSVICPNCGKQCKIENAFCTACGYKL